MLRELVTRWNRPVYEKETNYRAMRSMHDEPEAMEVAPKRSGGGGGGGRRHGMVGGMSQRDGASRDEAVGNILNERARRVFFFLIRIVFDAFFFWFPTCRLYHLYVRP